MLDQSLGGNRCLRSPPPLIGLRQGVWAYSGGLIRRLEITTHMPLQGRPRVQLGQLHVAPLGFEARGE